MRSIVSFILLTIINFAAYPQNERQKYIRQYQILAIKEMSRSGIPASIKMAQACLESGNGKSELSRISNNHFGIKCKRTWNGRKVYFDDDSKGECFRKYKTVEESYLDHTNFLMNNPRYAFLFHLPPDDYKGWARGLKRAGYATAPHYDKMLIKIIEDNKLYNLDYKQSFSPMMAYNDQPKYDGMTDKVIINPFKTHEIITVNDLKAVVAKKNDTYEIVAQELNMKVWELYKFNDCARGYVPQPNEVIYIEVKKRKAPRNHPDHVVDDGETMRYISQLYGIRLNPLYRRNRMEKGTDPLPGTVVFLRKRKSSI